MTENERSFEAAILAAAPEPSPLVTLVRSLDADLLKEFVIRYSKTDERFKEELVSTFGRPQTRQELAQAKEALRNAIHQNTKEGRIDHYGCNAICNTCQGLLDSCAQRLEQGHYAVAIYIPLFIVLQCVRLASAMDTRSSYLNNILESSLKLLEQACALAGANAKENEQNAIYEKLVKEAQHKVFDEWAEWNYPILRSATHFVTLQNAQLLCDALNYLNGVYSKWSGGCHLVDDKLTRLAMLRRLEGNEKAEQYLYANLDLDEFRRIAVQSAMDRGDFVQAEALCLEKTRQDGGNYSPYQKPSQWYYLLFHIYTISGEIEKKIQITESILLQSDVTHFDILKKLLIRASRWETEAPLLLEKCKNQLDPILYMRVLAREGSWAKLVEQLQQHPEEISTHAQQLAPHYPAETYMLYARYIRAQTAEATGRKHYVRICELLKKLHGFGGRKEAYALLRELRLEFYRRPAMLDELDKLEQKLMKKDK